MRKMVITLIALGVFAASAAFAGNLLNEGFTYPDGNLAGNGGWTIYSGTADLLVASGVAIGDQTTGSADDATPFAVQTLLAPTYACFNVMIPCASLTLPPKAVYFAGLKDAGTSLMVARVYVLSQGTSAWTFGISQTSTSTAYGATPWTSTLSCDTWYTVVIKYDPVLLTSTLWVNPVSEASPSVSNTRTDLAATAVSTFFLRQASASTFPAPGYPGTGGWKFSVDNLGVGTTFAEACYQEPVPTSKGTWGQLKSLYR